MKISVIIPNYNNALYLTKCLDSVFNQTIKDIEVIFIDDGSTDNSVELVKKHCEENNVDIILINQYNQNAAVARNKGIEKCTGEVLYFLDSDDEVYDDRVFENVLEKMNNCDLLLGNYQIIDENNEKIKDYISKDYIQDNIDSIYKFSDISPVPSNKFYKKSIIEKYNLYFDNVRIGQDLNFYLKYLAVCEKIDVVDTFIYKYRILSTSMTRAKNYNLFDIINSFFGVKKFYIKNGYKDYYDKYIALLELKHYVWQMEKLIDYSVKKSKKIIYMYFMYFISCIDISSIVNKNQLRRVLFELNLKRIFKFIYLSDLYVILKNNIIKVVRK